MSRLKSFAPLSETGLLGQPKDTPMTSLLGIDPSAMRRQAFMSGLARAGFTLMGTKNYGDVGAAFLQGANDARDDYQREALLGYQMRNAEEERQYQRGRDAKSDERWQTQWDYNVGRNEKADAWQTTQNQRQMDEWQRQDDQRAAADTAWSNIRTMPSTGIPVQNYGMADQLWQMGKQDEALGLVMPQQPEQMKPTDDMREYQMAVQQGYPGTFQQYMLEMRKAGAPQTNIGLEGDSYAKERGKAFATSMGDYEAAERAAFDTLASVDVMRSFMDSPNFYSGWGGQISLNARQLLATMGGNPDAAASVEAFNAESKRMALANMGGSLGTGFSNADRDFVTGQVANLDTSVAGNQALLEINRRVAERKIQIAQMARDYEIQNGRIDARFRQMLSNWALENPLFPEAEDTATQPGQFDPSDPLGIR